MNYRKHLTSFAARIVSAISLGKALIVGCIALLMLLSGCTVGPDFRTPEPNAQQAWTGAAAEPSRFQVSVPARHAWWRSLDDQTLTGMIEKAVAENRHIAIAVARVREARAMRGKAESRLLPQVESSAGYALFRISDEVPVVGPFIERGLVDQEQDLYQGLFDAQWEIDIFGGSRRGVEAAEAQVQAAEESRRAVLLSVIGEIVRVYAELRGSQARLRVLEHDVQLQERMLKLVDHQIAAGVGLALDRVRAEARLKHTLAQLPPIRSAIAASAYRLAVLTDMQPAEAWRKLRDPGPLPDGSQTVPIGLPGDLLKRRPDVRQAERQLHAATARIGVAAADLYPKFYLTGGAGLQATSFASLFSDGSTTWSIGPRISWPIFQGGRIRANIDAAKVRADAAYQQYQQVVLEAVADVEAALTQYAEAVQQLKHFDEAVAAEREAVQLARQACKTGLSNQLQVLAAERVLTQTEAERENVRTVVVVALAQLHKALGGGWQPYEPDDASARH